VTVEPATKDDFDAIVASLPDYWGERDLRAVHHPFMWHEFGDTALVARDDDGTLAGYLFGFVSQTEPVGYVHLIATRMSHRRRGVARALFERFERLAQERGAVALKAITTPANAGSVAFHSSMGMTVAEDPDYAGPGNARIVFRLALPRS
jgi:GNAT superfamily N-acetyltransferase